MLKDIFQTQNPGHERWKATHSVEILVSLLIFNWNGVDVRKAPEKGSEGITERYVSAALNAHIHSHMANHVDTKVKDCPSCTQDGS